MPGRGPCCGHVIYGEQLRVPQRGLLMTQQRGSICSHVGWGCSWGRHLNVPGAPWQGCHGGLQSTAAPSAWSEAPLLQVLKVQVYGQDREVDGKNLRHQVKDVSSSPKGCLCHLWIPTCECGAWHTADSKPMRNEKNVPIELVHGHQLLVTVAKGSYPWCFYTSLEPGGRRFSAQWVRLVELMSIKGWVRWAFSKFILQGPCGENCRDEWGGLCISGNSSAT